MHRIIVAVAFFSIGLDDSSAEPQYGICRVQVEADVNGRFQQKISRIEFDYITDRGGRNAP